MERKIGETFYYEGDKYVVMPSIIGCMECAFNSSVCNCNLDIAGHCISYQRKDRKGVIFVKLKTNDMKERNIKLSLEKAREFYKKGSEFRDLALSAFTEKELKEVKLPKTWEEFCSTHKTKKEECYIQLNSGIKQDNSIKDRHPEFDRNILCNRQAAVAHLAFMQLHQLRDCYRQGWFPENDIVHTYIQRYVDGSFVILSNNCVSHFLSFQNEEIANEFLNNFRDLIDTAGDLIG